MFPWTGGSWNLFVRGGLELSSARLQEHSQHLHALKQAQSGPLNRLNAMLSLLQPLDRYRTPSAIESANGRPYLALARIHTQVGVLNRLVLNRLRGSTAR